MGKTPYNYRTRGNMCKFTLSADKHIHCVCVTCLKLNYNLEYNMWCICMFTNVCVLPHLHLLFLSPLISSVASCFSSFPSVSPLSPFLFFLSFFTFLLPPISPPFSRPSFHFCSFLLILLFFVLPLLLLPLLLLLLLLLSSSSS